MFFGLQSANKQWGYCSTGSVFTYPLKFASNVLCASKTAANTTARNNLLIAESAVNDVGLNSLSLNTTSPVFNCYVLVIGI